MALLLICAVASCAAPASNKNSPLAQSTPIIYASTEDDGSLQAISARDGAPLWRTPVGHINWAPTIAGDTIYAVAPSNKTFTQSAVAVRLSDGKLLWQTTVPEHLYNPVLFADGQNIVVDGERAGLTALDPSDGSVRWSKQVQTVGRGLLHRGVYYTNLPGYPSNPSASAPALAAYRASDGKELWKIDTTVNSDIYASESALFAKLAPNSICALSQEDGHQLWKNEASSYLIGASDQIALIQSEGGLAALDAADGHALWSVPSVAFSLSSVEPLTVTHGLIIGAGQDALIAVNERDGTEAWRVRFDGFPYVSAPRVRGGVLFVFLQARSSFFTSSQLQIAALDAATGAIYWRLDVPKGQQLALFNDTSA